MTSNDANGQRSDATEPTRGDRSRDERRDGSAGDSDTASTGAVSVDVESAGVDASSSGLAVSTNFRRGGNSALETGETRLE